MKTTAECYQALLDGKKLSGLPDDGMTYIHLKNGCQVDNYGQKRSFSFEYPERWQIYEESQWYDNIPDGGMLCWVSDGENERRVIAVMTHFDNENSCGYKYRTALTGWRYATPLTKAEIQKFLDNAPE